MRNMVKAGYSADRVCDYHGAVQVSRSLDQTVVGEE